MRPLTADEKGHAAEVRKLQGAWVGAARRQDGRDVDGSQRFRFMFRPAELDVTEGDRTMQYQYVLDVTPRPKQLILSPPVETGQRPLLHMAYALEEDKLVICFDPRPGAAAPVALESKPGDGRILVTLKRRP